MQRKLENLADANPARGIPPAVHRPENHRPSPYLPDGARLRERLVLIADVICEEATGRANARPMTGSATEVTHLFPCRGMGCFASRLSQAMTREEGMHFVEGLRTAAGLQRRSARGLSSRPPVISRET